MLYKNCNVPLGVQGERLFFQKKTRVPLPILNISITTSPVILVAKQFQINSREISTFASYLMLS